ncbi:NAD(P)H-quinone oxidoreductase [Demequina sp.]|uniref:NAD(P)H-quinone oxidoreductase n=1 Tax=Demequina sp. TaxID=2050685 RepID=UPI003A89056F
MISTLPRFGGADVLTSADVPEPIAAAHEVVIHVHAAGVNRADILQREGHYPPPAGAPAWPGLEVSGTVVSVGGGVTQWAVGDAVCALLAGGGYAQRVCVHEDLVLPMPVGLSHEGAGGLVEAACTVWSTFDAADARAGQTLLVEGGSGGVGHIAVQLGIAMGMRVLTTARGPQRVQRCEEWGATGIDYAREDVMARVRAEGGADVILDVLGAGALDDHLRMLRTGGTLAVIGLQKGVRGELDLGRLLALRARIVGTTLRSRPHEDKARIVRGVRDHVWPLVPERVRPVVHATYPLERAGDAHRALESGKVFGKVVLIPPP